MKSACGFALLLIGLAGMGISNAQDMTGSPNPQTVSAIVCPRAIVDNDNDGLDDQWEDTLAARFAPVVYLHPDDVYKPSSVGWYLQKVRMRYNQPEALGFCTDDQILPPNEADSEKLTGYPAVDLTNLITQKQKRVIYRFLTCRREGIEEKSGGPPFSETSFFLELLTDVFPEGQKGDGANAPNWPVYVHVLPAPPTAVWRS